MFFGPSQLRQLSTCRDKSLDLAANKSKFSYLICALFEAASLGHTKKDAHTVGEWYTAAEEICIINCTEWSRCCDYSATRASQDRRKLLFATNCPQMCKHAARRQVKHDVAGVEDKKPGRCSAALVDMLRLVLIHDLHAVLIARNS
jgi:hypothetical protein